MSTNSLRAALRRSATVIVAAALTLGTGVGAAFAFPSGGTPATTGPDHIEWTGNGDGSVSASGTGSCTNSDQPGAPNTPYLYWVLTTDGGSVTADTANPSNPLNPVLHLVDNSTSPPTTKDVAFDSSSSAKTIKFITPYFTPNTATLLASATMNVTATGNGSWNLNISHGCAPPSIVEGQQPGITKNGAGAYTTTYQWNVQKTTSTPTIDTSPSQPAQASYKVVVTNTGQNNSGITVAGQITVNNPNNSAISLAGNGNGISDTLSDGVTCNLANAPPSLPGTGTDPSGNTVINYSCQLPDGTSTSDLNNLTNTVTVTWGEQMLDSSTHLAAGSQSYTLTTIPFNQNQVDNCVTPSDPQAPVGTFSPVCASQSPQTFSYTVNYNTQGNLDKPGTCTDHTNTVTLLDSNNNPVGQPSSADVKVCVGADLTVKKDATPTFTRTYSWKLAKSSSQDGLGNLVTPAGTPVTVKYTVTPSSSYSDSNWVVTGNITVTNPNDWEAVSLNGVTDHIDNGGVCSITSGDPNGSIAASSSEKLTYECDYSSQPSPTSFTNEADAHWDATAAFTDAGLAQGYASGDFSDPSTKITTVDQCISVSDTLGGPLGTRCAGDGQGPFTYSVTFNTNANPDPTGVCTQHPNEATLTTKDTGTTTTAGDSVTVCVAGDLGVAKTASPAFTRTYSWMIAKNATPMNLVDGGTVHYSVQVNQGPSTDSGWTVTGTITVSNPNQFESVTHVVVADNLSSSDAPCVVANGGPFTLPPGGMKTLNYTCTYAHAPSGSNDTNNGIATWDQIDANTPSSMSLGQAPFTWGAPTTRVNQTITPTDALQGAPAVNLCTLAAGTPCTLTASDSLPLTSQAYNYSQTFGAPSAGCPNINNTASTGIPGGTATATVTNCTLGALTMGFWHNNNGQKIIASVTPQSTLVNWLKTNFPNMFADASAPVGTYFQNVFAAAAANGNGAAMVKAQALALALNVYFGGGPGGNPINAPNPIGQVSVNVSAWVPAFGSPSGDITIMQMLQAVNAASNTGGTAFYNGNKNTASLAITGLTDANQNQVQS